MQTDDSYRLVTLVPKVWDPLTPGIMILIQNLRYPLLKRYDYLGHFECPLTFSVKIGNMYQIHSFSSPASSFPKEREVISATLLELPSP